MWLTGLVAPRHVGSSQTRARTRVPCIGRRILNHCATREAPRYCFLNSVLPQGPCTCCSHCLKHPFAKYLHESILTPVNPQLRCHLFKNHPYTPVTHYLSSLFPKALVPPDMILFLARLSTPSPLELQLQDSKGDVHFAHHCIPSAVPSTQYGQ